MGGGKINKKGKIPKPSLNNNDDINNKNEPWLLPLNNNDNNNKNKLRLLLLNNNKNDHNHNHYNLHLIFFKEIGPKHMNLRVSLISFVNIAMVQLIAKILISDC